MKTIATSGLLQKYFFWRYNWFITDFKKRLATCFMAFASVFSIATARFERDAQRSGMVTVQWKKTARVSQLAGD